MDYEKLGLGALVGLAVIIIAGVPLWLEMSDTNLLETSNIDPVNVGESSVWAESVYNVSQYDDKSDLVIEGTVTSISDARQEGSEVYRTASINVSRVLKGQETDEVAIRMQGGTIGDTTQTVQDAASYNEGDRVLAFLISENSTYKTLNMKHGRFILEDGEAVRPDLPEEYRVYELENLLKKADLA